MDIKIEEQICIRLGQYAANHSLSSHSAAIEHLLDNQQGVGDSSPSTAVSQPGHSRLEVVYFPEGEENFKQALLAIDSSRRVAHIRIHYFGGRIDYKQWWAADIDENSLIRGNLASGHLRGWRQKGIVKAEVSLEPFADDNSERGGISWQDRYKQFVRSQVKTPGPVSGYPSALDHLARTYNINVWRMTNIEEVRQVYQRFRLGSDLREVNYRYHNGRMSAAVRQYIAFLQSENSG